MIELIFTFYRPDNPWPEKQHDISKESRLGCVYPVLCEPSLQAFPEISLDIVHIVRVAIPAEEAEGPLRRLNVVRRLHDCGWKAILGIEFHKANRWFLVSSRAIRPKLVTV